MVVSPGFAPWIPGFRHDVPTPQFVAGIDVERGHPTAGPRVAGAILDDDLAIGDERRRQELLLTTELIFRGDSFVPEDLAILAIDGDDAAVGQIGNHFVFPERDAACARCVALVLHARIGDPREARPLRVAGIDLVHRAPSVGRVHEAVVDERIDLVFRPVLTDVLHAAQSERPHHAQLLDRFPVDLRQLGVADRTVVAVHQKPILRLVERVDETLLVDGKRVIGREHDHRESDRDRAGKRSKGSCHMAHVLQCATVVACCQSAGRPAARPGPESKSRQRCATGVDVWGRSLSFCTRQFDVSAAYTSVSDGQAS